MGMKRTGSFMKRHVPRLGRRIGDEEIKAAFEKMLQKCSDPAPVYTDEKWNELVESVKVCRGGYLIFTLTSGKIVKVTL